MQRTQLYLSEQMAKKLRMLSKKHRKTVSQLVREAVENTYLGGKPIAIKDALMTSRGLWEDRKNFEPHRFIRTLREDTRFPKGLRSS